MYIRRTSTRSTQTGESYYTYRLVRSERVDGKVRQLTLLNLGRHFEVEQPEWPLLCVRIEQLLGHQGSLLDTTCSASVERQAQRIAAQLIARWPPWDWCWMAREYPYPATAHSCLNCSQNLLKILAVHRGSLLH